MCSTFAFSHVYLWNRNKDKAEMLALELKSKKIQFVNQNINITVTELVEDCVQSADIIVTATFASTPILCHRMLKKNGNIHINGMYIF